MFCLKEWDNRFDIFWNQTCSIDVTSVQVSSVAGTRTKGEVQVRAVTAVTEFLFGPVRTAATSLHVHYFLVRQVSWQGKEGLVGEDLVSVIEDSCENVSTSLLNFFWKFGEWVSVGRLGRQTFGVYWTVDTGRPGLRVATIAVASPIGCAHLITKQVKGSRNCWWLLKRYYFLGTIYGVLFTDSFDVLNFWSTRCKEHKLGRDHSPYNCKLVHHSGTFCHTVTVGRSS